MSSHPQPPIQLSLNFDDTPPAQMAASAGAAILPDSSSGAAPQPQPQPQMSAAIIHLSRFRSAKPDYTEILYQRILDSVKHIG